MKLTKAQKAVLSDVSMYGSGVDFGGSGASILKRNAAKEMIDAGYLSGTYRLCRITDAGREALATAAPGPAMTNGEQS